MGGGILLSSGEKGRWIVCSFETLVACVDRIRAYDNLSPLGINKLLFLGGGSECIERVC